MKTVVGVFRSQQRAQTAAIALRRAGFAKDRISLLYPGSPEEEIHGIRTNETEQPGVGGAIGGMLGGALGVAGGLELGAVASALIPGVGPVFALGLAGALILGAGGVAGGAALGSKADSDANSGIPSDEVFFYEDALRQGRSVVVVFTDDRHEDDLAHELLGDAGAESLDAARKDWWMGLRDAESEHYSAMGHNFEEDEAVYRAGFESALRRECRGKDADEETDCLKWWYPDFWDTETFRLGYERGRKYWERQSGATNASGQSGRAA